MTTLALDLLSPDSPDNGPFIASGVDGTSALYMQILLGRKYRFRLSRTTGKEYFPDEKDLRFQTPGHMMPGPEVGLDRIDQVLTVIAFGVWGTGGSCAALTQYQALEEEFGGGTKEIEREGRGRRWAVRRQSFAEHCSNDIVGWYQLC